MPGPQGQRQRERRGEVGTVVAGGLLGLRDGLPGPPHSQLLPGLLVGVRGLLPGHGLRLSLRLQVLSRR